MKMVRKYFYILYIKELCCSICYYLNLHYGHKTLLISDEDSLKKENITIEYSRKEFDEIIEKTNELKNTIEKEIIEINTLYDNVNKDIIKTFEKKHEILMKEENDLREKLQ